LKGAKLLQIGNSCRQYGHGLAGASFPSDRKQNALASQSFGLVPNEARIRAIATWYVIRPKDPAPMVVGMN
jgi:hypothetical protein